MKIAKGKTSEPVLNSKIADVLRSKHPRWNEKNVILVEQSQLISESKGKVIDIAINLPGGVPVVVETERFPAKSVENDAKSRLGEYLSETGKKIEQSIAVRIPERLAEINQNQLFNEIGNSTFEFALHSINLDNKPTRYPNSGWIKGDIDYLADAIEQSTMSENSLYLSAEKLKAMISEAADILQDECESKREEILAEIANVLKLEKKPETYKVAMAIVVNALTFHMSIAGNRGIKTLDAIWSNSRYYDLSELIKSWQKIVNEINYVPIFQIAIDIVKNIPPKLSDKIFENLYKAAKELDKLSSTGKLDRSGQIFQILLSDQKFRATFYTLPTSAKLIAELTVGMLNIDWRKQKSVKSLRIADFTCGTGAILSATYHSILSKCRRNFIDDKKIHANMIENSLVGTDIMPVATHLTASILAGVHSEIPFKNTSVFNLPYGKIISNLPNKDVAIGALDLLSEEPFTTHYSNSEAAAKGNKVSNQSHNSQYEAAVRELWQQEFDIVILNPPYTRSVNHAANRAGIPVPSFAGMGTSEEEQRLMSRELKSINKRFLGHERAGNGIAGLATNFIDLANKKLSEGGILAIILPHTFAQGASWTRARNLLEKNYSEVTVVGIANSNIRTKRDGLLTAFSSDTGLSELLLVAKKVRPKELPNKIKMINLVQRPSSVVEAVHKAREINDATPSEGVRIQEGKFDQLGYIGMVHDSLFHNATNLANGLIRLPRGTEFQVPFTTLGELGSPGYFHLSLTGKVGDKFQGPFDHIKTRRLNVEYPTLWKHNAKAETHFEVSADSYCKPRKDCDKWAVKVWNETKSRLHYNSDFRFNSQPLAICMTEEDSIGGRAWPNFICKKQHWEIPLVVWLNSTLGLISYWWTGSNQQPGRTLFSKSTITKIPIIDVREFNLTQLETCQEIFDWLNNLEVGLLPAHKAYEDPVRLELDKRILVDLLQVDLNSIAEEFDLLRRQWCHEPSVYDKKVPMPLN